MRREKIHNFHQVSKTIINYIIIIILSECRKARNKAMKNHRFTLFFLLTISVFHCQTMVVKWKKFEVKCVCSQERSIKRAKLRSSYDEEKKSDDFVMPKFFSTLFSEFSHLGLFNRTGFHWIFCPEAKEKNQCCWLNFKAFEFSQLFSLSTKLSQFHKINKCLRNLTKTKYEK